MRVVYRHDIFEKLSKLLNFLRVLHCAGVDAWLPDFLAAIDYLFEMQSIGSIL